MTCFASQCHLRRQSLSERRAGELGRSRMDVPKNACTAAGRLVRIRSGGDHSLSVGVYGPARGIVCSGRARIFRSAGTHRCIQEAVHTMESSVADNTIIGDRGESSRDLGGSTGEEGNDESGGELHCVVLIWRCMGCCGVRL